MTKILVPSVLLVVSGLNFSCNETIETPGFEDNLARLEVKLESLNWVAYAPTNFDPASGIFPSKESLRQDLLTLYNCPLELNGLITYSADGTVSEVPKIGRDVGFQGIIMGIWNPKSTHELEAAQNVSDYVDAFCIGNEQLGFLYTADELEAVMNELRDLTQKPVTTTEEIEDYQDEEILGLGDFVFPNAHPYWNGKRQPEQAVVWTVTRYTELESVAGEKKIFFKEVGLPTAGEGGTSEENQMLYYTLLSYSKARFAYFEAFDQPWKAHHPVEPHWGLFYSDRSPKKIVQSPSSSSWLITATFSTPVKARTSFMKFSKSR